MTQEQIERGRIAIAERCGFTHVRCIPPDHCIGHHPSRPSDVPNYHGSLDAMHEAEKALIYSKRKAFRYELQKIMSRGMDGICLIAMEECIHATAPQRFEAMLCVLTPERENAR